jgi:hypothetical protein
MGIYILIPVTNVVYLLISGLTIDSFIY